MEATINTIMNTLKAQIGDNGIVDVGRGAEEVFGVSRHTFNIALALLVGEGYVKAPVYLKSMKEDTENGTGKFYVSEVLAYKGADPKAIFKNTETIEAPKWDGEPKATPESVAKRLAMLMKRFGRTNVEIAEKLDIPESKVRVLLNEETA